MVLIEIQFGSEFGVRSLEFGVWSSEFGVRSSEFGVRSSEYALRARCANGVWSTRMRATSPYPLTKAFLGQKSRFSGEKARHSP